MHRTVLLEVDEWQLIKPMHDTRLQSLPIHSPCNSGCSTTLRVGFHKPRCSRCGKKVPDQMEAAYILHNWEVREKSSV